MKQENIKEGDIVDRLADYIEILGTIGNQYHLDRNFFPNKKFKDRNIIVRVNQFEFSLYPKSPLKLEQFQKLKEKIINISKNFEANLHLLLSSIPLELDGKILSCVIYVECGEKPIITVIAKNFPSSIDINYSKPFYRLTDESTKRLTELEITTDPTFQFVTAGEVPVSIAIEICHDHGHGHAQKKFLEKLEMKGAKEKFPLLVTHVISSNSVCRSKDSMVSDLVTHVDPMGSMVVNNTESFLNRTHKDAVRIISDRYPMTLHQAKMSIFGNQIMVNNPPFSHNYALFVTDEYELRKFSNKKILAKINSLYEGERLLELKKMVDDDTSFYLINHKKIDKQRKESIDTINSLLINVLSKTDDTFDRLGIIIGSLLLEARKAQTHHESHCFQEIKGLEPATIGFKPSGPSGRLIPDDTSYPVYLYHANRVYAQAQAAFETFQRNAGA